MTRTISFEYDPEHIPKLKDEIEVMMMQIKDEAYQKGIVGERQRIITLLIGLREAAQKDKGVTTNININALISLIKDTK
jgi:hypothetical protein